jgi:uncharacterized coiled-coil DUF342 family protein
MSDSCTNSVKFYGPLLENYEQTLERHYHHLTRVIRPHLFYGWLRAKGVFTQEDQEEVENKFITTCLKAGRLIDIIKTKGQKGFVAFMEVVEYEYPEIFSDITEQQPRLPPREFSPKEVMQRRGSSRRNRNQDGLTSSDVLTMIGDLTSTLTKALAVKSEQLHRLTSLIDHMKMEHDQVADDNEAMYREVQALRETIEELNSEKNLLNQRVRAMKDERDHALQQCDELRKKKDNLMEQCHQLLTVERTTSLRNGSHSAGTDGEVKFVKKEFSSQRKTNEEVKWPVEEIGTLKSKLLKKQQMWDAEKKQLESQIEDMESQHEKSVAQLLGDVTQIKAERDQALQQLDDAKKKYTEEVSKNEKLSEECHHYVEQFKRMEETIENLKREIDQRNRQTPRLGDRGMLGRQIAVSFEQDERESQSVRITVDADLNGSPDIKRSGSRQSDIHPLLEKAKPLPPCRELSGGLAPVRGTPAGLYPELKERRKGSFIGICPFILYAPEELQHKLHTYLLKKTTYFDDSVYDITSVNSESVGKHPVSSNSHEIIHEKMSPDGRTHYRLTVESLRRCLSDGKHAILLQALPIASIDTMRKHSIQPVVVMIKLTNENECCELTAFEESLSRMSNGLYETVDIDRSLANNFEKFAEQVLSALLRLVQKYIFLVGLHSDADSVDMK